MSCPVSVCLSFLSVCDVGVLWPNGWMDQDEFTVEVWPRPRPHCVIDGDSAPPPQKGHSQPPFLAHVCCDQTAGWIKMPLGAEVDLGPVHIVSDWAQRPLGKGHRSPPLFSAHVCCGQTVAHLSYC